MVVPASLRDEYPWQGDYLTVDGHRLHYLDEGDGPPLLMVHGNPTWSFYWRHLVKGLSDDYRCVVPDHLGCGLSDQPDAFFRLEDRSRHLAALIEHLDLRDLTLVVHDWGGPIGLHAALRDPGRVARLVIFNTGVFEGPLPLSIKACRWPGVGSFMVRTLNGFIRAGLFQAIADRSRLSGPVREGYLLPYRSAAGKRTIHQFVQDIPLEDGHPTREAFFGIDDRLGELADRPTLIVWGEQDFCFTPYYRRGFEERFPDAEVHALPDAAHWVVEDAHERILPWMRDFLAREATP